MPSTNIQAADAHPEELCSIPVKLTFGWMTDIVWRGYKHDFRERDVLQLASRDGILSLDWLSDLPCHAEYFTPDPSHRN